MTDVSISSNGSTNKKKLTGRDLAAWIRNASVLTKLCIAAAVMAGEIEIIDLTITQVARMFGLKSKQIKAIAELTPEQRAAQLWAAIDRVTAPTRIAAV
jgi:hypothetical protein